MIVVEYKVRFHKLDRHATMFLSIEYEIIWCFIRVWRFPIRMVAQSLVDEVRPFIDIINYVYTIKGCIARTIGATIKNLDIRVTIVRIIVVFNLGVQVFRHNILRNNISVKNLTNFKHGSS